MSHKLKTVYISLIPTLLLLCLALPDRAVAGAETGADEARLAAILLDHREASPEARQRAAAEIAKIDDLSQVGIRALVQCLHFGNANIGNLRRDCMDALVEVGPPAVPELLRILRLDPADPLSREMFAFVNKRGAMDCTLRIGEPAAEALARIRDPRAAELAISEFREIWIPPNDLPRLMRDVCLREATARSKLLARILMSADDDAQLQRSMLRLARDPSGGVEARLDVGLALAFQATPTASKTLLDVVDPDGPRGDDLLAPVTQTDFSSNFAIYIALGLHPDHVERAESLLHQGWRERPDIVALVDQARGCGADLNKWFMNLTGELACQGDGKLAPPPAGEGSHLRDMLRIKAALFLSRRMLDEGQARRLINGYIQALRDVWGTTAGTDLLVASVLGLDRQATRGETYVQSIAAFRDELAATPGAPAPRLLQELDDLIRFLTR